MQRGQTADLVLLLVWPIIASLLSFLLDVNILGATTLFLILPGAYLTIRARKSIARAALFSLACMPIAFVFEYFAIKNGAWRINPDALSLPSFFGTVNFEAMIWYFAWIYLVILFYEHFLDKDTHTKLGGPRLKYMFFGFMAAFAAVLFLAVNKLPAYIPYTYLVLGAALLGVPLLVALLKFPHLFTKLAKVTLYFVYLHMTLDMTVIALGHWDYPGDFIGWFELFGQRLPAEELLFWIVLGAAALVTWYHYFDELKPGRRRP